MSRGVSDWGMALKPSDEVAKNRGAPDEVNAKIENNLRVTDGSQPPIEDEKKGLTNRVIE